MQSMMFSTSWKGRCICAAGPMSGESLSEAESYDPPSARYVLDEIGKLYAVEDEIRKKNNKCQATNLRKENAYPIIKGLEVWTTENLLKTP